MEQNYNHSVMGHSYAQPYVKTNPRTVRGAKKRGWHIVDVPSTEWIDRTTGNYTSWLGLEMWADRHCSGFWVSGFMNRQFAFEKEQDASAFLFHWFV